MNNQEWKNQTLITFCCSISFYHHNKYYYSKIENDFRIILFVVFVFIIYFEVKTLLLTACCDLTLFIRCVRCLCHNLWRCRKNINKMNLRSRELLLLVFVLLVTFLLSSVQTQKVQRWGWQVQRCREYRALRKRTLNPLNNHHHNDKSTFSH